MNNFREFNKVFCIGLSRTGTTSLAEALNNLGLKTIHFPLDLFLFPESINSSLNFNSKLKRGFLRKRKFNNFFSYWHKVSLRNTLSSYDAFSDLPIPIYFKELDQKFPNSKFIHTYRNEEAWLKSMKWLYNEGAILWKHGEIEKEVNYSMYECVTYNEEKLRDVYRKYNESVLTYFKNRENDFLLLNIDEGDLNYNNICNFLNLTVPDLDFPKSNSKRYPSKKSTFSYYIRNKFPLVDFFYSKIKYIFD